jgi:AAA+ ATPase superfamily predicted ATPase
MSSLPFVGRRRLLDRLNLLFSKKTATLAVIKGRRRVGKSRLIQEFAEGHRFLQFSGIPPEEGITAQDQRDVFAKLLGGYCGFPSLRATDWSDLFQMLADQTRAGQVIILFDEISWMATGDATFLGKLKNAWDLELKKNHQLILILCGSVSVWIEENILSSTGYFGRIPVRITLEELPLYDCNKLLEAQQLIGTTYEKFQLLAITGGIPWYLEQLQPDVTAEKNIRYLCFTEGAIFLEEYGLIFHDIFGSKGDMYEKIIRLLADGDLEYNDICDSLNYVQSGMMSRYLKNLITAGFVSRDFTWLIKKGKPARLSKYRLSDNYLRFYLKYIEPKQELISQGLYQDVDFMNLPGWYTVMGYQFENLVLKNRKAIFRLLGIEFSHIVANNPYFQRKTTRHQGCQIDFLIQTLFNTLFVCEIKFSKNELGVSVIEEVEEKIRRLSKPRGFSCFPVLIHVNGVSDAVIDKGYFYKFIDLKQLLDIP